MEYWAKTPEGHSNVIEFTHHDYPDMFESSFDTNSYFLTQEVKSWLVKNNIKVFVRYETQPYDVKFSIKFESADDASQFMDKFAKWGEDRVRLEDI